MSNKKKILAISGSMKSASSNSKIIAMMAEECAAWADVVVYKGMITLPYFNPDLDKEETVPVTVSEFRNQIQAADAVLICTPEYVFSLPGVLKNALEWTVSTTVFSDKPAALITAAASGQKAAESLELIMRTIGAKFNEDTMLLIQGVKGKVDGDEAAFREQLTKLGAALAALIES